MSSTVFNGNEVDGDDDKEKHNYVQGLPCGVWISWAGRFSKHALVERDGTVSLTWTDKYKGTWLKAKGRVEGVLEIQTHPSWIVWEITMLGDYKFYWFQDPEGSLPGGFLSREEGEGEEKAAAAAKGGPRGERELRNVEYRFTLRGYRSNPGGTTQEAREETAAALAGEDAELMAEIRATLEAPGFPFIMEEPMLSQAEKMEEEEFDNEEEGDEDED